MLIDSASGSQCKGELSCCSSSQLLREKKTDSSMRSMRRSSRGVISSACPHPDPVESSHANSLHSTVILRAEEDVLPTAHACHFQDVCACAQGGGAAKSSQQTIDTSYLAELLLKSASVEQLLMFIITGNLDRGIRRFISFQDTK